MSEYFSRLLPAVIAVLCLLLFAGAATVLAEPTGANVTQVGPSSRIVVQNVTTALNATAGNVTELAVNGQHVTHYWQGYYGNVSGSIILGTSDGYNLYEWNAGSASGEVFASRNGSNINWTGVNCASATEVDNEDTFLGANSGSTADSLNQTFNYTSHPSFQLAGNTISGCPSTPVNGSSSSATGFWNVFLEDNGTNSSSYADNIPIYAAIIDPRSIGFNGKTYDFQMLVGEPGNGSEQYPNGNPTTYYFYVELS